MLRVNPRPRSRSVEQEQQGLLTSGAPRGSALWLVWPLALGVPCQALARPLHWAAALAAPLARDVHCKLAGAAFLEEEGGQAGGASFLLWGRCATSPGPANSSAAMCLQ